MSDDDLFELTDEDRERFQEEFKEGVVPATTPEWVKQREIYEEERRKELLEEAKAVADPE